MSDELKPGQKLYGQKGNYTVEKQIGYGGNSLVYRVAAIDAFDNSIQVGREYAVKFFHCCTHSGNIIRKREERFRQEIKIVCRLQNQIAGILPILDQSLKKNRILWFVMPLAEKCIYSKWDIITKLKYALNLGMIVSEIHNAGYAHRDIKPGNVLFWEDRLFLADYGLARLLGETESNLTEPGEVMGPLYYRPPEMVYYTEMNIDYQKSDVYMFAKTLWSFIRNSCYAFPGEYKRVDPKIYLDPEAFEVETFEAIHQLMEGSTKDEYRERISIREALELLTIQIKVLNGTYNRERCARLKAQEKMAMATQKEPAEDNCI